MNGFLIRFKWLPIPRITFVFIFFYVVQLIEPNMEPLHTQTYRSHIARVDSLRLSFKCFSSFSLSVFLLFLFFLHFSRIHSIHFVLLVFCVIWLLQNLWLCDIFVSIFTILSGVPFLFLFLSFIFIHVNENFACEHKMNKLLKETDSSSSSSFFIWVQR